MMYVTKNITINEYELLPVIIVFCKDGRLCMYVYVTLWLGSIEVCQTEQNIAKYS